MSGIGKTERLSPPPDAAPRNGPAFPGGAFSLMFEA